ncbi:MAG: transcriptional regulator GutM [Anaerolineae bacterium]|nr:transcriptional regulator GutM [Anaerolineae bacterium]
MNSTTAVVILGLGFMWLLQYVLTFWQMRRYSKRLSLLRKEGWVWVGLHGSAWKGRTYAVVVVNGDRIIRVEQLSGWTVMAGLKPVPGFEGRPVSDLTDDSVELPGSEKLKLALRDAVTHMETYARKQAEKAAEAAASETGSSPLADCVSTQA